MAASSRLRVVVGSCSPCLGAGALEAARAMRNVFGERCAMEPTMCVLRTGHGVASFGSVALPDSVAEPLLRTVMDLDAVIAGRAPSVAGGAARASAQL